MNPLKSILCLLSASAIISSQASETSMVSPPKIPDIKNLIAEDMDNISSDRPTRIGVIVPLKVDMAEAGEWSVGNDGRKRCVLHISAPMAKAISLYYEKFHIPQGGELYIHNARNTHHLPALTSADNPCNTTEFATEYIAGDECVLEYIAGKDGEIPEISISDIGYAYNHVRIIKVAAERMAKSTLKPDVGYNASFDEMVDINCSPEGDLWQNQKNGIAKIVYRLENGQFFASGTLVNNARNDNKLYWLTADHNFRGRANSTTYSTMIFYFENERRTDNWNPSKEPSSKTITGAKFLYGNFLGNGTDIALLEITGKYDNSFNLFWNGWDIDSKAPESGASIHHPKLDVMKISTFSTPAFSSTWRNKEAIGIKDGHWGVSFIKTPNGFSLTQKGSDGAPLFNQDGLVVGVLTGRNIPYTTTDTRTYYGKISACWNIRDPQTNKTLGDFLDPDHTGIQKIEGRYADGKPRADFRVSSADIYLSLPIRILNHSYKAESYSWDFPGAAVPTSNEENPVVTYTAPGTYSISLTINKGTKDEHTVVKENCIRISEKTNTEIANVSIGAAVATGAFPLGYSAKQSFDASLYTMNEINRSGDIRKIAWHSASSTIQPQTVYIYLKETEEKSIAAQSWSEAINGATLVYKGADYPWNHTDEWCEFDLETPFCFSGNKNIMVMVRTIAKSEPLSSNQCYYTTTDNKHLEWTSARSSIPTSPGIVNSNRPDIRFGFGKPAKVEKPVPDFAVNPDTYLLKSDFEGEDYFRLNGWTVENNAGNDVYWKQWNYQVPFSTIDHDSRLSAVCLMNLSAKTDTRLISPAVAITDNCILEFYAGYSGSCTGVTFSISSDDGSTWEDVWTPGYLIDSGLPTIWRKQRFDLAKYAGKEIRLAWSVKGKGVGAFAIDNVTIHHPSATGNIEIFEGENIYLKDMTSEPVVSRKWEFPGGISDSDTEPSVRVRYDEAGVYDVAMTVSNSAGEEKTIKKNVITVKSRCPIAAIGSTAGYKLRDTDGRFIPAGTSVDFKDLSSNYPRNWKWRFPGAETFESDARNPEGVIYGKNGLYDVILETSNPTGGTDTIEAKEYIHAGGTERIWNMPDNDNGESVYTYPGGYVTGTNKIMNGVVTGYAERFARPLKPCDLISVDVMFHVDHTGEKPIKVSVYEDKYGIPGNLMATTELQSASVSSEGYTTVTFPHPVGISGAFHIAFENFNASATGQVDYSLAIKSSRNIADKEGTATIFLSKDNFNGWAPISKQYDYNLTLNIVPTLRYSTLEVSNHEAVIGNNGKNTQQILVESDSYWTVSTNCMWIDLSSDNGSGNGSFYIGCKSNPGSERSGIVTVGGGGKERRILVRQTGASPHNLTASSNQGDITLNWESPAFLSSQEIMEDSESMNAFEINPKGKYGWNYIDGDGSFNFNFKDHRYPNEGQPAAFIVFNPLKTSPSSSRLPGIEAHSGNQFLACINSNSDRTNDWIISPELNNPEEFIFSFWAKTYDNSFGAERIRIAYSTSGKEEKDFTQVVSNGSYEEVPSAWTEYSYNIPAEARYVAINCVSDQAFMLMIDDIYIGTKPQDPAGSATTETVRFIGNGMIQDGFGFDSDTVFETAVRYDSSDLYDYHEGKLTAVDFYPFLLPGKEGTAKYTIKIRRDGQIILQQAVENVEYGRLNRVILDKDILIDAASELMIGYEVDDVGGKFPAGYDMGPVNEGKGNLISTDGGLHFYSLTDIQELDVNWVIGAVMTPPPHKNLEYNVYRDGDRIATTTGLTMEDNNVPEGKHDYYVVAAYGGERESDPSNICSITVANSGINEIPKKKLTVYPNVVAPYTRINVDLGDSVSEAAIRILDMNGIVNADTEISGNGSLIAPAATGIYIIEVICEDGSRLTDRIIVK